MEMESEFGDDEAQLEQSREMAEKRQQQLNDLGRTISKVRREAVSSRADSGFERQWLEDENYYDGVDEFNRSTSQYLKPRSENGGLLTRATKETDDSTIFPNITRPFVDAASSRLGDILLPANEWNFGIKPTPIPGMEEEDDAPSILGPDGQAMPNANDAAKAIRAIINEKVEKASTRIKDWLTDCRFKAESRKVVEDGSKVGSGVFMGPLPTKYTETAFMNGALEITESVRPASKRIDYWDFFPDMNCGENIQDGEYVFYREWMTARQLLNLKGMESQGYVDSAIDHVIEEGPSKTNIGSDKRTAMSDRFEVWYFYGSITQEELSLVDSDHECECDAQAKQPIPVTLVLVNDTVIKGHANVFETQEYPFDVFVWQRVPGKPFGIGVARQGRPAQEMVTAAARALMDNMSLSAIPMMGIIRKAIEPQDKSWKMRKGKIFAIKESSGIADIRSAIQILEIPDKQQQLTAIIELGIKLMEDATGISFLLQGQQGSAPDTVGGMQLMHNNASSLLRRCARIYDENVTEPHIRRYHRYLLVDEDVPIEEKGDLQIEAVGSSSLVEREIQAMQMQTVLEMSMNPIFEKSPKKAAEEMLRAMHLEPSKFDMDEEERQQQEQMMQAQQNQPLPQVEAAKIRAEVDMQKEQMRQQMDMQKIQIQQQTSLQKMQVDTDRDNVHVATMQAKEEANHNYLLHKLELERELAMLKYANDRQITLDKAKADLAEVTMKLNLQKELAMSPTKPAEQVVTPISEPPQRAKPGQAFQQ